jgi:hypothetical protein
MRAARSAWSAGPEAKGRDLWTLGILPARAVIDRVAGGKIEVEWAYDDVRGMLQQIGAASRVRE